MKLKRTLAAAAAALVGAALVAGCASNSPSSTPTTPTSTPPPPQTLPLTGKTVDRLPAHPAVSIKIPADHHARPQTGLNRADNVWVELVEGGETRYDAVFYSDLPDNVGPVRSVRPVDGPINAPLGGVLLCSGGQKQFLQQVGGQVGALLTEDTAGGATKRIKQRRIPFNLYADATKVAQSEKAASLKPPAPQWDFAAAGSQPSALAGADTPKFDVLYPAATSHWEWTGSAWQRFERKAKVTDADGSGVQATNVVVLAVQTKQTEFVDPVGAPVVDTLFTGSGPAKVAAGGKMIDATWTKTDLAAPVKLTDAKGAPVKLAPGNVWIELVPARKQWLK